MASSEGYDGSVTIDTRIDTDAFDMGIEKICKSLKNLSKVLDTVALKIQQSFNFNANSLVSEIDNAGKSYENASDDAKKYSDNISKANEELKKQDNNLKEVKQTLSKENEIIKPTPVPDMEERSKSIADGLKRINEEKR